MRARGDGSVYERPDGKWVAQVYAGTTASGRPRKLKRIRNSKRDALRALKDLQRIAGSPAAVENVTVAVWSATWLDDLRDQVAAGTKAVRTVVGYEQHIRVWIVPHLGHIRLDQLAPGHVARLMTSVQAVGRSPTTARSVRATVSAMLSAAVADGLIQANVARPAKPPPAPKPRPSAFTEDEFARIVARCRQHRLGPMFELADLTGMRLSELVGLRWGDIDLEQGTYQVAEPLHRIGPTGAKAAGVDPGMVPGRRAKSAASGEATPLASSAVELLREQRVAQAKERLASSSWHASGRVFTDVDGRPLTPSKVETAWRRVLADAEVPYLRADGRGRGPHELRRTFATRLRDAGVAIEDVMRLGRWASPQVLLAHYAAVDDDRLRRAADAANR